jgi:hypothetical protein
VLDFDDETRRRLFGADAAEDESPERFIEYFFRNAAYSSVTSSLPLRILVGHKGVGKSALLRRAYLEDIESKQATLWLRPNEVLGVISEIPDSFLHLIESWKAGLQNLIGTRTIEFFAPDASDEPILGPGAAKILTRLPTLLSERLSSLVDPAKDIALRNYLRTKRMTIYLDDLDRGWKGGEKDIQMISALIDALRDLSNQHPGLCFRLGLRSDVYYLVRTSDESTDKIEGSVTWLTWTNHELLTLLAKRIETFFGREINEDELVEKDQKVVASYLWSVMEERFEGAGHWKNAPMNRVIASLVRHRPRDLVKLCNGAGIWAKRRRHGRLATGDFTSSFELYSQERLQDLVNEFKAELGLTNALLLEMKPSTQQRKEGRMWKYRNDELVKKLRFAMGHHAFIFSNHTPVTPQTLASFLYKIDFITARRDTGGKIDRKFFDQNRYLQNQFVDFGYDWEVHMAYRWALSPSGGISGRTLMKFRLERWQWLSRTLLVLSFATLLPVGRSDSRSSERSGICWLRPRPPGATHH